VTGLLLMSLSACSNKPEAELSAAEQALSQVQSAEAEIYAPEAYLEVTQLLDEAKVEIDVQSNKFVLTRNFDLAKEKLIRFKDLAETCMQTAQATKERVRKETEASLAEAEQALNTARAALETAPEGKGTKADLEALKADLQAAQTALAEAREIMSAGRYHEAGPRLAAVKGQANSISSEIEQAMARSGKRRS